MRIYKLILRFTVSKFDKYYLHHDVPISNMASQMNFLNYLSEYGNHKGKKILEIGSREVTSPSVARKKFNKAEYTGFDYYPAPNVDVVGDAHKLSQYFDEQFDVIFSCAVFEHLAMPWLVSGEIAKLLKTGGLVYIQTHFSFSSHERPWHFFQFSDMGLKVLFSPALGFECIEAGMSNPIVGRFSSFAEDYLKFNPVKGLYCHSEYLGKKVRDVPDFSWENARLEDLVTQTKYPEPGT